MTLGELGIKLPKSLSGIRLLLLVFLASSRGNKSLKLSQNNDGHCSIDLGILFFNDMIESNTFPKMLCSNNVLLSIQL